MSERERESSLKTAENVLFPVGSSECFDYGGYRYRITRPGRRIKLLRHCQATKEIEQASGISIITLRKIMMQATDAARAEYIDFVLHRKLKKAKQ